MLSWTPSPCPGRPPSQLQHIVSDHLFSAELLTMAVAPSYLKNQLSVCASVRPCVCGPKKILHDREVGSKSLVNEKCLSKKNAQNAQNAKNAIISWTKNHPKKILETNLNIWEHQAHLAFLNFLIRPLDHGETRPESWYCPTCFL